MLTTITIDNFRSIEHTELELAPLVVLYGPTASGKSSLLYALLVLKNFVVNPNRPADGYLHLGFMDLGGFEQCVFNHENEREMSIGVFSNEENKSSASYRLSFSRNKGTIQQKWGNLVLEGEVPIPYGLNQTFPFTHSESDEEYMINWNGIACSVSPQKPTATTQQRARQIAESVNAIPEKIKAVDAAPHRRGFFKPSYTNVPISPTPTAEDEVASLIINDPNLAPRISAYAEEIFERDFRLYVPPGTATVFFQTTEKKSRTPGLLVNDGFGVNQVVYLLAKLLRVDVKTLVIEEPEIHLHPTALRNFTRQLCAIAHEEKKQMIFTTHSESFISSLLASIAEGMLTPGEIKCCLCAKEGRRTTFKPQVVQRNGQIEGGLTTFVEAELEDLKKLLGIGECH
jgi:energy-coupling factor transporter ATP-binding protein EcfA2